MQKERTVQVRRDMLHITHSDEDEHERTYVPRDPRRSSDLACTCCLHQVQRDGPVDGIQEMGAGLRSSTMEGENQ